MPERTATLLRNGRRIKTKPKVLFTSQEFSFGKTGYNEGHDFRPLVQKLLGKGDTSNAVAHLDVGKQSIDIHPATPEYFDSSFARRRPVERESLLVQGSLPRECAPPLIIRN